MRVIVFRNRVKAGVEERYDTHASAVFDLAVKMPGFVSSKDFVAEDGERLSLIEFAGETELAAWRNQPDHRAAQEEGRRSYYQQYSIQVCELLRESRFVAPEESAPAAPPGELQPSPAGPFEGGCACGNVRYRASGPPQNPSVCHCTLCRRFAAAPAVAWVTFRTNAIEWLSGAPKAFPSSEKAERSFCAECGTPLTFRFRATPELTDLTLCSLDEPARVPPADHIYTSTQVPWLRLADGLPRFEEGRKPRS